MENGKWEMVNGLRRLTGTVILSPRMKHSTLLLSLFLAACGGAAAVSSRPPAGNPNAVVVVAEYSDLQCPACAKAHAQVTKPILGKYGNQIRFEFRHFPLRQTHRFALDAAEMSECAADQGKFWEFVDHSYENQQDMSFNALTDWADIVGMNVTDAERCWKSHGKRKVVLADYSAGRELGVAATPTYFVNGTQVEQGFDTLSDAIDRALEKVKMDL